MKRVLGIDCGSVITGYGVIDTDGRACRMVTWGVIIARTGDAFPDRLKKISDKLSEIIQTYSPHDVAVEDIFYSVNAKSALKLGQVRGVALLKAADAGLPVHEYAPLLVKSSVVGYGRAEKSQVQQMVKLMLGLDELPPEDAADALAVAICHANHSGALGRLQQAVAKEKSGKRSEGLLAEARQSIKGKAPVRRTAASRLRKGEAIDALRRPTVG
ncbi:MAG: crossover junction endodeoxyribonuclease RuvC [Acidobacteria bacterium RIFCSPLOWO2_12_FULL_54_10]|nr:MAG: crossover junction endodeoxyribonuclease RuvC [Acidobacteria bacterium RIFCSPLOWO2_12_FULL_54_10]